MGDPIRTFEIAEQEGLYYPAASRGRERESKGVERSSDSPEAGTLRLATLHESESCKRGGWPASTFRAIKE